MTSSSTPATSRSRSRTNPSLPLAPDDVEGGRGAGVAAVARAHEIVQPFKQAHREIYLLTDADAQDQNLL